MRQKIILLSITLSAILLFSGTCSAQSPFIPQHGKLLIIGQQKDAIDEYLRHFDIPSGFMFYTSIQDVEGLDELADHGAGEMYADYYRKKYPSSVIQLAVYMKGALKDIISGRYDRNIYRLAKWIKRSGKPVYLRLGYEFDWPENNYDPEAYQQAFRYIVKHFRAYKVKNAAFVWHSAVTVNHKGNFMDWYPGDDYVDWFAISFFHPAQMTIIHKFLNLAQEHHKPLMIAESSPLGVISSRAKKDWFKKYFNLIENNDFKVVSYINSHWNTYPMFKARNWGDARLQTDPEIKALWRRKIKENFLPPSFDLFKKLGP